MTGLEITGTGLMLGLANGPACLVACVPALVPVMLTAAPSPAARRFAWPLLGRFLCGRLIAYTLVGILAGLSGSSLQSVSASVAPWVTLLLALLLIAHGLGLLQRFSCRFGCPAVGGVASPLLLGALTGFTLCPPFLLALTWVWSQGIGPLPAALFFLAFFLGTSLYLLPLGFSGYLTQSQTLTRLGRVLSCGVGLFFATKLLMAGVLG